VRVAQGLLLPLQEEIVVKRKDLHLAGIVIFLAFAVLVQGCGIFNPDPSPPKKEPLPPWPPDSPSAVIANMEYAYNKFDYERYGPLIRDDFTFIFNQDDVTKYPGQVPSEGWWDDGAEKESSKNMLDANYEPSDPLYKIDNMQLVVKLSGELRPSNLETAPEGTLEGYVTFDLSVETVGGALTLLVHSRPLFYFAPDVPGADKKIWRLWKIEDAPFDED